MGSHERAYSGSHYHNDHQEDVTPSDETAPFLLSNLPAWRRLVCNFTPSWFSVNMGTGIVSILLHNLPFNSNWLYWTSVGIFCTNILLFVLFLVVSVLRYILHPGIWRRMISHPQQSLFIGTFPMGFSTIVTMFALVCVPHWGQGAATTAWVLWWIDAVLACASCFYLPWTIMHVHKHTELESVTAAWLLPIVATIVAASTGAVVAGVLDNAQHALWTIVISYVLWGTGVPLAMSVLVIYFHRLTVHKLPPKELIVSCFLPLGPLGQGAFVIQRLGVVARKVFPLTGTLSNSQTNAGDILFVIGWVVGLVLWGYALVWMFFALASISRSRFPFNMGWWGFTFPLGVFATATVQFGVDMPSQFFSILGTILSVAVTMLWIMVSVMTFKGVLAHELVVAPCLK